MTLTWAVLDVKTFPNAPVPQGLPPQLPLLPVSIEAGVELHLVVVVPVGVQTLPGRLVDDLSLRRQRPLLAVGPVTGGHVHVGVVVRVVAVAVDVETEVGEGTVYPGRGPGGVLGGGRRRRISPEVFVDKGTQSRG